MVRIDAHVHVGRWKHPPFAGLEADAVAIAEEMRRTVIEGVALTSSDVADHSLLIEVARSLPLHCWLFFWVNPEDPSMVQWIQDHRPLIRGLKIHASLQRVNLDDPKWDPFFELASDLGLQVIMHTGRWQAASGFSLALDRAARWPRVQCILSHAGGDTPELSLAAAQEVKRRRLANVFFNTAGLREHWALSRAMQIAGPERYMMGSDFPLAPPRMYLAQIEAMRIPDAWKEGLVGRNARQIFGEPVDFSTGAVVNSAMSMGPPVGEKGSRGGARCSPFSEDDALPILITGAGGPIGVNLTRSLRLAKRHYRLIGSDANRFHRPMALTDLCLALPRASDPGYIDALNDVIRCHSIQLIMPTHPSEIHVLSENRAKIETSLFLPPHETVRVGENKYLTYERLRAAGVPAPRSLRIDRPMDIERAFLELGPAPIWFRGSGSPGVGIGVASLACRQIEHAQAWVDHHRGWGQFMASEYLPGENYTWMGIWHSGVLWACQARERLEYVIPHVSPSGITGAPAVTRTVHRPELREIGEAAVRAIGDPPHGIFFVDLKTDTQGQAKVTEINPGRFGTTLHFYTAAGFNFPELAVELALGQRPNGAVCDPIPEDVYWLRTLDCGPVLCRGRDLEPT